MKFVSLSSMPAVHIRMSTISLSDQNSRYGASLRCNRGLSNSRFVSFIFICFIIQPIVTEKMVADRPHPNFDDEYPGTAVMRMMNVRARVRSLTTEQLNGDWVEVRRKLLWAGGLKDLPNARPGQGYTGHSFNDFNHCDLTTMLAEVAHNNNEGSVQGIAYNNQLGPGIEIASVEELGPGGSWTTCMMGCNSEPPQDVAHVQFKSKIAFKLVWCPPAYTSFVLVDDSGNLLKKGSPTGNLPHIAERMQNFQLVAGSKYATEAERCGLEAHTEL